MSKGNKKDKVPKITEAEYAAYLSVLRGETDCAPKEEQERPQETENEE